MTLQVVENPFKWLKTLEEVKNILHKTPSRG
jgi:hypothetical protein